MAKTLVLVIALAWALAWSGGGHGSEASCEADHLERGSSCSGLENVTRASYGNRFVRQGYELKLKSLTDRLIRDLEEKGAFSDEYLFTHWDGTTTGKYNDHLEKMYDHVRAMTSEDAIGFSLGGIYDGLDIQYELHEELTKQAGGVGYFRLSGDLDLPPQMFVAIMQSGEMLGRLDDTVRMMHMVHTFSDKKSILSLWVAAPGFPFLWRDGLDGTSKLVLSCLLPQQE